MRLYDVQIMLNAANSVDKQQHTSLQQGQLNQSQNAITINEKAAEKLYQPQEPVAEPNSRQISSDEKKQKRWPKKAPGQPESPENDVENPQANTGTSGKMIDIKI
jgi:hypothetical protein